MRRGAVAKRRRRLGPTAAAVGLAAAAGCLPTQDLDSYSVSPSVPSGGVPPSAPTAAVSDAPSPGGPSLPSGPAESPAAEAAPSEGLDAGGVAPALGPARESPDLGVVSPPCAQPGEVASAATGSCYFLAAAPAPWAVASDACRAWGGTLVQLDSPAEGTLLGELIAEDTWIGANDRASEGTMRWQSGELVAGYQNWAPQQPDDYLGAEDCVQILLSNGQWNDRPCDDFWPYLCERAAPP